MMYLIVTAPIALGLIYYTVKNNRIQREVKHDRRQRLKDAQDQYNKAFGIETEDKLTEFENIK